MKNHRAIGRAVAAFAVLALVAAACSKSSAPKGLPKFQGTKGGIFKAVSSGDIDYIDPGQSYYTFGYEIFRVTTRNLMQYPPLNGPAGLVPTPDLATAAPTHSADFSTWTFKIRSGVKFGPPVNRAVKTSDIKYGIERMFNPNVGGQYNFYLDGAIGAALEGAKAFEDAYTSKNKAVIDAGISGITTPDDTTIVFKFASARADVPGLVTMPGFAPVPEEYAQPLDAKSPSTYGPHQVSSGPYMFKNDASGKIQGAGLGWDPNKKIDLIRNSNYDQATDPFRKNFPDEITIDEGYNDPEIATQKILNGEFNYNFDFQIPADKQQAINANATQKTLLRTPASPCFRYVSLNTTIHPFTNVHVRRAVAWILNKDAMRKTRGGAAAGQIAGHIILPILSGFNEAGGATFDPYATPNEQGDLAKATAEMKLAAQDGEPNIDAATGKYTGSPVLLVGSSSGVAPKTTAEEAADLAKIGIKTTTQQFTTGTMYSEWYQVPSKKVAVASNAGWCIDYPDTFTLLAPILLGPGQGGSFPQVKNNNYSLFNDTTTNSLVAQVAKTTVQSQKNSLFAQIDKQAMDQVPLVPWLWDSSSLLVSPNVKNFVFFAMADAIDLAVVAVQ